MRQPNATKPAPERGRLQDNPDTQHDAALDAGCQAIRAVVEAFAEGKIELEAVPSDTPKVSIRYAPSFVLGNVVVAEPRRPYTAYSVARFIGWTYGKDRTPQDKVHNALAALASFLLGAVELTALVLVLVPLAWAMLLGRLLAGVAGAKAVRP